MQTFTTLVFCLGLALAYGSPTGRVPCSDLTGTWRNQLGSNMTVTRIGNSHKFTGRYNTSVESTAGASTISSDISGQVQPVAGGSLVAFNVLWNHGASLTAWVGQCLVCDGQEKLYTTWVLRSVQIPRKRWMSTRINQDTFWRVDENQATALDGNVNVPTSDVLGNWKSVTGDSVEITQASEQGSMEGLHKAPGAANGATVYGRFDGNQTYTALGFAAANDQYIRGWAGHIYNSEDRVMETSWLSHKFSNLCNDPRKYVEYGMDYYSK
ncbi:avidin-related protein 4/5-like [Argiope bruennichi]|uniref:avidin-related protein 4/5-like n=1 Tax=Argiope bruennichi TaxID=94029 RepID=UPI0024958B30|nr:avidin-related protein 4/5-like [Argiope bruennichi]